LDAAGVSEKARRFIAPVLGERQADHILRGCATAFASGQYGPLLGEIEAACSP
jgi:hypothetical protein